MQPVLVKSSKILNALVQIVRRDDKMRQISLSLVSLGIFLGTSGCAIFSSKKTNSEWDVLSSVDKVSCASWPLAENDIQVNEIKVSQNAAAKVQVAFAASVVKRNGAPGFYYVPFDDDAKLNRDDLVPLKLGRGSILIGSSLMAETPVVGVVRNQTEKAIFELRTVKDNVVRFSTDAAELPIADGEILTVDHGAWLSYRRDDNGIRFSFIDWEKPTKIEAKNFRTVAFGGQPVALAKADKSGILALWRDDKGDRRFQVRNLARDGQTAAPVTLDVKIDGTVESWSAASFGQGYFLAYVEGDSLVGQATLRVAYFNWRDGVPVVQWQKEQIIKDVHVGEPMFSAVNDKLDLLLLNWVDDESTIARYQVSSGTLGQPKFSGVFERGARLVKAFTDAKRSDSFVLMRYREDNKWTFKVCEL
jgi:hypothetical protein